MVPFAPTRWRVTSTSIPATAASPSAAPRVTFGFDAYSGDGHITLEGRLDALNVKTGDGSIDARIRPGSKIDSGWSIRTGDGSVDVTLPAELQANIEASTNDGHITMGIPLTVEGTFSTSQLHGKMNGGGQPIVIHTGDGSIRLSKA
jgi:hypothetical protein